MKIAICTSMFPVPELGPGRVIKVGDEFPVEYGIWISISSPEVLGITKKCLTDYPQFFRIEERPDGPWKPAKGEFYWFIDDQGEPYPDRNDEFYEDRNRFAVGNCYRTKEEAESHLPAVRAAYKGKSLRDVLNDVKPRIAGNISSYRSCPDTASGHVIEAILAEWEAK